jgi:hypothetical protein
VTEVRTLQADEGLRTVRHMVALEVHVGPSLRLSIVILTLALGCGSSSRTADGGPGSDAEPGRDSSTPTDAGTDWGACDVPSDCVIVERACCASCGTPPTLEAVDAVNGARLGDWREEVCPVSPGCPPCLVAENPNLAATCSAGRCTAFDLSRDHGDCTVDTDCVIRVPDCCPCGADTSIPRLVAIAAAQVGDYVSRVCDPMQACLECEPAYPPEVVASCLSGICTPVAMMSSGP